MVVEDPEASRGDLVPPAASAAPLPSVVALEACCTTQVELAKLDSAIAGSHGYGRYLAERVRRLQSERPDARAQWAAHCDAQFGGVKDPLRHTAASLRDFLSQWQ